MTLSQIQAKGLEHLLEKKTSRKKSPGRPRYSLDKRAQFSLTYWFNLLMKEYSKLRPIQRVRISLDCWKTLINKANNLPADPIESKLNADETMQLLKDAENNLNTSTTPVESHKELVTVGATPVEQQEIERGGVPC